MKQGTAGLVLRMAKGGSQASDRLMGYYYPRILRVVYLISGSHADSKDIVQEAFVPCWMNRKKIGEPEYFGNWLYKTFTRETWWYYRENRKGQSMEGVLGREEPETASVLEEVMMHSRKKGLYRAIRNLPVEQRTAAVLYYSNQISVREIAGIMGCLGRTVKSRLFTAKANLKQELMEENRRVGRGVTL